MVDLPLNGKVKPNAAKALLRKKVLRLVDMASYLS